MINRHGNPRILLGVVAGCLLAAAVTTVPAWGQTAPPPPQDPIAGKWTGTVTLPGGRAYEPVIRFERTPEGGWNAAVYASAASEEPIQPQSLSISGTAVTMRWQSAQLSAQAILTGNYQSWNDVIRGVLMVSDLNLPIQLERVPPPTAEPELGGEEIPEEPARIRHSTRFAVVGRAAYWNPIYILKDNVRNINDITTHEFGWDAGLQWYIMDGLALCARYVQGGLGFDTNQKNLALFGFTGDEFLEFKGPEISLKAYLGNQLVPTSDFNPYLTAYIGSFDWSLGGNGRGSTPVSLQEEPLEDTSVGFGAGLGTEYALSGRLAIEVEWLWRYFMTEDKNKWTDIEHLWTNTHAWTLSLGAVIGF